MRKYLLLFILLIFVISVISLLNRPSTEFDEGVYWTTFLLQQKDFTLYKLTYMSQLPGFFIFTNPIFLFFGSTLQAARLSILFWSGIGLLGIIWISYELKNILIGFLTIAILYFIPFYYIETATFHVDLLGVVFSSLSIASILRFQKTYSSFWFFLSVIFLSFAIVTKFNLSSLIPIIFVVLETKVIIKNIVISLFIMIVSIVPFFLIFGFVNILTNVFHLRSQAVFAYSEHLSFFQFMQKDYILGSVFIASLLITCLYARKNIQLLILKIWLISNFIILILYTPLMFHHMIFILIPSSLFVSIFIIRSTGNFYFSKYLIILFIIFSIMRFAYNSFQITQKITSNVQNKGIELIKKYTQAKDFVISDDGILNAVSGRLPPPPLSDISEVRINSGNINSNLIDQAIKKYRPKAVLAWNNRLLRIKNIEKVLTANNYKLTEKIDDSHKVYLLSK